MARGPAMLVFLDASHNAKGAADENFGGEVMELLTTGVGSCSEEGTATFIASKIHRFFVRDEVAPDLAEALVALRRGSAFRRTGRPNGGEARGRLGRMADAIAPLGRASNVLVNVDDPDRFGRPYPSLDFLLDVAASAPRSERLVRDAWGACRTLVDQVLAPFDGRTRLHAVTVADERPVCFFLSAGRVSHATGGPALGRQRP